MYHSISDEPESHHPYFWTNTSPARFAEHMKYLHDNGYNVISLSEAVNLLSPNNSTNSTNPTNSTNSTNSMNSTNPTNSNNSTNSTNSTNPTNSTTRRLNDPVSQQSKYVVLTFDDGYLDFYTHAFPILRKHNFTATVFLPTVYIDGKQPGLRGKKHLNWDQVRELHAAGISFGSHTVNHYQLYDLSWKEIEYELRESKSIIEYQLYELVPSLDAQFTSINKDRFHVESFCYPYKFPSHNTSFILHLSTLMSDCNYLCNVSTRVGSTNKPSEMYCLKRVPINSADDSIFFSTKLSGLYDWIALPQIIFKRLRNYVTNFVKKTS